MGGVIKGDKIKCCYSLRGSRNKVIPCASHNLRSIERERVRLVWFGPHLVGFGQNCVCEEVVGLKVEL